MKSIIMSPDAHLAEAEVEGIVFERGVAQPVADDAKAEVILRHPWFDEEPQAPDPAPAPVAKPAPIAAAAPAKPPADDSSDKS